MIGIGFGAGTIGGVTTGPLVVRKPRANAYLVASDNVPVIDIDFPAVKTHDCWVPVMSYHITMIGGDTGGDVSVYVIGHK